MSKEFDDELDRASGPKGRSRARNSKHGSSSDEYYLDDDFNTAGYESQDSEPYDRRQPARPAGRPAGEGQEYGRSGAAAGRASGSGSTQGGTARVPGSGSPQGGAARVPGSGSTQGGTARVPGSGSPQGRVSKTPAAAGSRPQGDSRKRPSAGSGYELRRQEASLRVGDSGSDLGGASKRRTQDAGNRSAASRSAAQAAKKKKVRRAIIFAVAEVLTLICIGLYSYALRISNSLNRPNDFNKENIKNVELTPEKTEHMKGYWTIAVFGVDSRDGNVHKGTNTDVIMLCNINRDTGEIKLVSVFRDTYLNISDNGTYNKINSAYANGGAEQALAALNKNLDLDIKDYVTFNWKAVADGINMLGGVDGIDISKAEFRYINSFITETVQKTGVPSVQLKAPGVQHLDGVQAVAYGRLRLMDTDYARTERQRLIIEKAFQKAKTADIGLLNRILLMEVEQIETSLEFGDFTDLILDIAKYHIGETGGFPFARDAMIIGKKGDCVVPQTLESNVSELHRFLYGKEDYQPTEQVKKISAKISADSGMYKPGVNVGHVPTDNGYIPKETEATKKAEEESSELEETESVSESETIKETDENGDPINPTRPGETTAEESRPSRPGETAEGETKPTKPGETTAGESKPTKPGETTAEGSKPTKPGETTAEGSKPTKPGETTAEGSKPSKPGETTGAVKPSLPGSENPSDSDTGPGVNPPKTPQESTTSPETSSPGPGDPPGPGSGTSQPGNSGNNSDDVLSVPPIGNGSGPV